MLGAGRREMPTEGDWYLTGTIDARESELTAVDVWVSNLKGRRVQDSEIEVEVLGKRIRPERVVRILIANELPKFDLEPGLYLLCCKVGELVTKLPFFVRGGEDAAASNEPAGQATPEAEGDVRQPEKPEGTDA